MKIKIGALKALIREGVQAQLKEFNAKHKEDEFLLQLFSKFPIKKGFNDQFATKAVMAMLKSFGPEAMDFVTNGGVWAQKIQQHNRELPAEDVKRFVAIVLRAIGA